MHMDASHTFLFKYRSVNQNTMLTDLVPLFSSLSYHLDIVPAHTDAALHRLLAACMPGNFGSGTLGVVTKRVVTKK